MEPPAGCRQWLVEERADDDPPLFTGLDLLGAVLKWDGI